MIGQVLNNRYEIEERLGGGGMAVVYRARDAYLGRPVSIKVLRDQFASDVDFVQRFRREAQAVASLSHPNVVSLYDVGQEGEQHYLVMEYVEGQTLKDKITSDGPLPPREAARITRQILNALEHAHAKQVVHRDIKPHNILITSGGRVKVTDFGIARANNGSTLVHTGSILGSAHYFSPEQARGWAADQRSDLYALGVVLYEMLTGQVPFEGENPLSVALKHVREAPPSPRQANPLIPPDLDQVVTRALAKDPARRYQSVAGFRSDLDAWAAGRPLRQPRGGWEDDTLEVGLHRVWGDDAGEDPEGDAREAIRTPETHRSSDRRWRGSFRSWAVAALLLLALAGYSLYLFMRWFQVPAVPVPEVTGITQLEAERRLEASGLRGKVLAQQYHNEWPPGFVIDQKPRPPEELKRGAEVGLVVSQGPELVTVPDVVRKHRQEAHNLLAIEDLEVQEEGQYDEQVPEGYVIAQNPNAHTLAKRGSTIFLKVSNGPPPPPLEMPDLTGSSREDAVRILQDLKLVLRQEAQGLSGFPEGRVAAQSPAPRAQVREGDGVDLLVSQGCAATDTATIPVQTDLPVTVRITVQDQAPERVIYEREHQPGDLVNLDAICWDGTAGRLTVYFNQTVVSREVLGP